ncbi:MAG: DUF58 domain-containing protein [Sulfuricellaceae bacterium]
MNLRLPIDRTLWRRIFNRMDAEAGPVVLDRKRIFILPTRHGLLFSLALLAMLIGSINYNLGLGYVLTFLLGSMGLVSILHAYRNLAQLQVRAGKAQPVFVGQPAVFSVCLDNPGMMPRYAVGLVHDARLLAKLLPEFADLPAGQGACLRLEIPAVRRGRLAAGRFTLFTHFPLGLFRAWSNVWLDATCIVYPKPDNSNMPLPVSVQAAGEGAGHGEGREDFASLRPYRPGDSLRQVAWKAAARGQGLFTKQFFGQARPELWLDWEMLPGLGLEERLSRLCRWVLDADAAGLHYGLRLPDKTLELGLGKEHQRSCLEALALFGMADVPEIA